MIPPFTTVVAVDRAHADELEIVWPTWVRFRPEILSAPLIVITDCAEPGDVGGRFWPDRLSFMDPYYDRPGLPTREFMYWFWPLDPDLADISQRERMLTSFLHLPAMKVTTPYWLKLDTDLVALRESAWIDPRWFAPVRGVAPALIAPPWSYTKPAGTLATLDEWAFAADFPWPHPPLDPQRTPGDGADYLPRIISWCCWINTEYSQWLSELLRRPDGTIRRLPIPSQDTLHWYAAARLGLPIVRPQMKRLGWAHCSRLSQLKRLAAEALEGVHA